MTKTFPLIGNSSSLIKELKDTHLDAPYVKWDDQYASIFWRRDDYWMRKIIYFLNQFTPQTPQVSYLVHNSGILLKQSLQQSKAKYRKQSDQKSENNFKNSAAIKMIQNLLPPIIYALYTSHIYEFIQLIIYYY